MGKIFLLLIFGFICSTIYGQNCVIKGVVHDTQNNQSLPYAKVKIVSSTKITLTDTAGNFELKNLQPGYIVLEVSYTGYATKRTTEILLVSNNVKYIDIGLETNMNEIGSIKVMPSSFLKKEESPISMQSISTKEIESNPGSNRDISRVIQSFPGVGSTPAFRNDVIIRGGGPAENRFFLDGIEIPVLNHFATQGASGGPVGIINADFIRSVDFYSSAFPAAKYNALSGVFDFKQKDGNSDRLNTQIAIGASEASLTFDGPLGKKTNFIFSLRRSYLQFLFSAIGLPFLPTFNDYQTRVKMNINKKNQLTFISIGSLDNLVVNTGIKNPDPSQKYIINSIPVNNQWSYTIGTDFKHFFSKGYHAIVLSRNMLRNNLFKYPDNDETKEKIFNYQSDEIENKLRYEYKLKHKDIKFFFTGNFEYASYLNHTQVKIFIGDVIDLDYKTTLHLFKFGASGQITKRFLSQKLLTSFGIRFDANNYNASNLNPINQFSPRLSFSYKLNSNNKINASAGRYFQQAAYTTLGYRNINNTLMNKETAKYICLYQYNIGLDHFISDKIMISIEGFYKQYSNYPIDLNTGASIANQGAAYSIYGAGAVDFSGKGKAFGIELLNRWNYKTFSILASYTIFRSLFSDINNLYIASAWDSRHILTITTTKKLKKHWQIGIKWRYVGGLPYTPYDMEKSAKVEVWFMNNGPYLDYSQLNAKRLTAFHQLDLRIDKNFFFKKWSLMIYFDVQNAYNFKSEAQNIILRKKTPDGTFQTTDNGTNYVLETYPYNIGTILPTLGIMLKF